MREGYINIFYYYIYTHIFKGMNTVKLLDIVRDQHSKTPNLIFEHVNRTDFEVLYPILTAYSISCEI